MNKEADRAPTPPPPVEHRLAAILHADVQGYSRLLGEDETATLRLLTPYLIMMRTLVQQYGGRAVGSRGDSLLAEFPSVVAAVHCAVVMQQELKGRNTVLPEARRVEFRIGVNLGEIVVDGDQLHGDGINIAVRLEGVAEAGGICISEVVYRQVKNRLALSYEDVGEQRLKNIAEPVRVWRVRMDEAAATLAAQAELRAVDSSPDRHAPQRPVRAAYRTWARVVIAGLVLLGGGIVTVRYLARPLLITQFPVFRPEAAPASLPLPDKPSIVVLPFVNLSGDPEQDYFSDGLTEILTSSLSKLSSLFVIARNSAFTYKGKAVKVQEVSKELGVRYVLEGSVLKADHQIRITAQLIDATAGNHLWSERYDRPLQDLFALQDEVTQKVVLALKVQLTPEEQERFKQAPTDNLDAYDDFLRGWEYLNRSTQEATAQARHMFAHAIEVDPRYAAAYAFLGLTYLQDWSSQWGSDAQSLEQAFALAQRAVALDDSLPLAHLTLGRVYLSKKQYAQALAEGYRARALDPNNPDIVVGLAEILLYTGTQGEPLGLVERALRLNPHYPDWYLVVLGRAYDWATQKEQRIAVFKRLLARNPDSLPAHLNLAVLYGASGQEVEARAEVAEMLRISPNFSLEDMRQRSPLKDLELLESSLDLLGKAGLK